MAILTFKSVVQPLIILCFIESSCPTHLKQQDDIICPPGLYGFNCQYNCSDFCNSDKCNISAYKGVPTCYIGCKDHRTGVYCQELCPSRCLECNQNNGTCKTCISGYFGRKCQYECNSHCVNKKCDIDGSCILNPYKGARQAEPERGDEDKCLIGNKEKCTCCRSQYRGLNCEKHCQNCQTWYYNSNTCDYQCKTGLFGNDCNSPCPKTCAPGNSGKPLCEQTESGQLICLNGCIPGHTGMQCDRLCIGNCKNNACHKQDGKCIQCNDGNYGDICLHICSNECKNGDCFRNGTCKSGCKMERYGERCDRRCPKNCYWCTITEAKEMICFDGCIPGYHGVLCEDKCSRGCKDNICSQVDGRCEKGCLKGLYGVNCTRECGKHCKNNNCVLDVDDSFLCSDGCRDGYKGKQCNHPCPVGCATCAWIYEDDECLEYITTTTSAKGVSSVNTSSEMLASWKIIVPCTLVSSLLIGIGIGVVFYCRRGRRDAVHNTDKERKPGEGSCSPADELLEDEGRKEKKVLTWLTGVAVVLLSLLLIMSVINIFKTRIRRFLYSRFIKRRSTRPDTGAAIGSRQKRLWTGDESTDSEVLSGDEALPLVTTSVQEDTENVSRTGQELTAFVTSDVVETLRQREEVVRHTSNRPVVVYQHFRNVNVAGGTNVSIGGPVTNIAQIREDEKKPMTVLQAITERTSIRIASRTKGAVKTSTFGTLMETIDKGQRWITVTGDRGEGKSTAAYMALKELQRKERQVFQVIYPEEFTQVTATYSTPVILLDGIFGAVEFFDKDLCVSWESVLNDFRNESERRINVKQMDSSLNDSMIILVLQKDILQLVSTYFPTLSDLIAKSLNIAFLPLSEEAELKDKSVILTAILKTGGINLDSEVVNRICSMKGQNTFPQICRLFLTVQRDHARIDSEVFFKKPLEFLNQTVEKFMYHDIKVNLFKVLLKEGEKISVNTLRDLDKGSDLIEVAYQLEGHYLRKEGDMFMFDNYFVSDSIEYNIAKRFPRFVIESCRLSLILKRFAIDESICKRLIVNLKENERECLAKRFAKEVDNLNIMQVLSHEACRHQSFLHSMMMMCILPMDKVLELRDQTSKETFLYLVSISKSPELLKYILEEKAINLGSSEMNTVFLGACKFGALEVITYMSQTSANFDVNAHESEGKCRTALMIAADTQESEIVEEIISYSPNLKAVDSDGATALHYLCKNGQTSVRKIINSGETIDLKDNMGLSPLDYACKYEKVETVKLLIEAGACLDSKSVKTAFGSGNLEVLGLMFSTDDTLNKIFSDGYTPLHIACDIGNLKVVQFLVGKGCSVNLTEGTDSALHIAAGNGSCEVLKVLLMNGANVHEQNERSFTPLHKAVESDHVECVRVLLEAGANVNTVTGDQNISLHLAVANESRTCLDLLLKGNPDVNAKNIPGFTPLYKAAEKGKREYMDLLIKAGADVNSVSMQHSTALHKAVESGTLDCVELLLKCGASPNVNDEAGETPLMKALMKDAEKRDDIVKMLLTKGADVGLERNDGDTALQIAASKQLIQCLRMLLEVHPIIDRKRSSHAKALHKAVESGSYACVLLLRKAGTDVNVQSDFGYTPLHKAVERDSRKNC